MKETLIHDKDFSISKPLTVVMATYNGARFLEEQLNSILNQTLPPREIIVCDDKSTDGTVQILEKYKSSNIRYSVNDLRLGYVENFKKAASLASPGHYVALSDQDDVWLPRKLEAAMETLLQLGDQSSPMMVYSDLILVDENLEVINPSFRNELGQDGYVHCLPTLLFGGFVNGCTMLMNPAMTEYFSSIPKGEFVTHDTWMALIGFTFGKIAMVPEPLIYYRRHRNNTTDLTGLKKSNRISRIRTEILAALRKNDLFEKELDCVGKFFQMFADKLNPGDRLVIASFLRLKGKSYVQKKIALRTFFRGKWK